MTHKTCTNCGRIYHEAPLCPKRNMEPCIFLECAAFETEEAIGSWKSGYIKGHCREYDNIVFGKTLISNKDERTC